MTILLFYLLLHVLLWGAIGAVLAMRAGVSRWIGVLVSVFFPVLGSLGLLLVWWQAGRPPGRVASAAWRRLSWIGVAGGALILIAAWLPWISGEVRGQAEDLEVADFGFDSASFDEMVLLGSLLGVLVAAFAYAAVRTGRGAWPIASALAAWLGAFIAGGLVLTEGFIDEIGHRGDDLANATTVVSSVHAELNTDYSIGLGPYVCLLGSMIVLIWAFVWGLKAPSMAVAEGWRGDPVVQQRPTTSGSWTANDWGNDLDVPGGRGTPGIGAADDLGRGATGERSNDVRSEWDW